MRYNKYFIAVIAIFCGFSFPLQAQVNKIKKAIIVIVDGIPADMIERIETPHIDEISKAGGYTRAYMGGEVGGYSETPTISAVCYTSMITGTWGNKHNVWNNDLTAPNYHYWSLFRYLRHDQSDKKLGIYSTWLDNRTKLLGEGLLQTNHLKFDIYHDGYEHDTIRFPHDKNSKYINNIDEEVVRQTSASIRTEAPDLSWVYLQYTDDAGHLYGDGEGMVDAIVKADRQVGDIYQAVKYREQYHNEDWMVVIITDHGRDVATGYSHGKQTDRERTIWISTNAKGLNQHFYAHQPAIVDILPSVLRYMDIRVSPVQKEELDGVPFVGSVSLAHPKASVVDNQLLVNWTPFSHTGKVKIKVAKTNYYKESGIEREDTYENMGEFDLKARTAKIPLPSSLGKEKFLKVVIEGEHNTVNYWVVRK